ncbi:MAG: hypothetical protein ACOC1J_00260 [Prolixibacteraceae bacterium]
MNADIFLKLMTKQRTGLSLCYIQPFTHVPEIHGSEITLLKFVVTECQDMSKENNPFASIQNLKLHPGEQ